MEQQRIANGGSQYVPQIAVQYVYLDFDGELTSYNGEILTVDNVEVLNSSLTAERIANIVAELNAKYASQNVIFVTQRPKTAGYSTIFIGKTSAFDSYGNFSGLAETIDKGNKITTDNAFVMLDSTSSDEAIISTISHETDHLLGTLDHGGEGLAAYAARIIVSEGIISSGLTVVYGNSMFISSGGTAYDTVLNGNYEDAYMYIANGGYASNTTVASGRLYISSGGTAENTELQDGTLVVYSGGSVAGLTAQSGTLLEIRAGGKATDLNILDGATTYFTITNDTVLEGSSKGKEILVSDGVISNVTIISSCSMNVESDWKAYNTVLNGNYEDAYMYIKNGGYASNTTVASGVLYISSGGTAEMTTVQTGLLRVSANGAVGGVTIQSGARLTLLAGGTATDIDIQQNGIAYLDITAQTCLTGISGGQSILASDGVISNVTIISNCSMNVESDWKAYNTVLNGKYESAYMYVLDGGYAETTSITSGKLYISSGGEVQSSVLRGGAIYVKNGGCLQNTVASAGNVHISSGGRAINMDVLSGAKVYVNAGGSFTSINLQSGATLILSSGAILESLNYEEGAVISAAGKVVMQGSLDRNTAVEQSILNGLNIENENFVYRINSKDNTLFGKYLINDSIGSWNGTISLYANDLDTGVNFILSSENITNETVLVDGVLYTLSEEEGKLYLNQRKVFTCESFYYDDEQQKGKIIFTNELSSNVDYAPYITIKNTSGEEFRLENIVVCGNELEFSLDLNPADYYTLSISPDLPNILSEKLNADGDITPGEENEDCYTHVFSPQLPLFQLQTDTSSSLSCYTGDTISIDLTVLPTEFLDIISTQCALNVYLSSDKILDSSDILLNTYLFDSITNNGVNHKAEFSGSQLPLGGSYLIFKADTAGMPFKEASEYDDNVQVFSIRNDLELGSTISSIMNAVKTLTVTVTNAGAASVDAPLICVSLSSEGHSGVLSLNQNDVSNWPFNYSSLSNSGITLSFLADSDSTPGSILANSRSLNNLYYSMVQTQKNADTTVHFQYKKFYTTDQTAMDWDALLKDLAVAPEYLPILQKALEENIGATIGDYVSELNKIKAVIATNGACSDISAEELFKQKLYELSGSMCPISTQAASEDLTLNNNRLMLSLNRKMSSSAASHYQDSVFGYGWSWNWDAGLQIHNQSAVTVTLPNLQGSYKFILNSNKEFISSDVGVSLVLENNQYIFTSKTGEKYIYSSEGHLLAVQDRNDTSIYLTWNNDQLLSLIHSDGTGIYLDYNQDGRISAAVSSNGDRITYLYDSSGNMISTTDAVKQISTIYAYDDSRFMHNITSLTDYNGAKIIYGYDQWGRLTNYAVEGSSLRTEIEYGLNTVTTTDQNGNNSTLTFNTEGQVTATVDSQGNHLRYTYDADGNITQMTSDNDLKNYFAYDEYGNCISITDEHGNTTSITYVNNNIRTITDSSGNETTFFYDGNWNISNIRYANGTTASFTWDEQGCCVSVTDIAGLESSSVYDEKGNILSYSSNGKTISFTYDATNNITSITNTAGDQIFYTYNTHNQVTSFTDEAGTTTSYSYDTDGNLVSISYGDGSQTNYVCDEFANLLQLTNARGQEINYTYNDQLQVIQDFVGGRNITLTYDNNGNISQADNMSFSYDTHGNLLSVIYDDGRKIIYEYDKWDRLISQKDETGNSTCYTYDKYGNLDCMSANSGELIVDYDFNLLGQLVRQTNGNNTSIVYSYNQCGDVEQISYLDSTGNQTGFCSYTYDIERKCTVKATENGVWNYTYDVNNRLISEIFTDNNGVITQNNTYTYDSRGNRLTSNINGTVTTYIYDNMNRIVSANGFAYRYDADGNLLEDEERTYTWTADNKVATETLKATGQTWTYGYDAIGNRISSTTNGVTTLWTVDVNGDILAEYIDGVQTRNYYQGYSLVGFEDNNSEYFFNTDLLGSVLTVTNTSGEMLNNYTYDAFGNILKATEGVANDFKFVGSYGLMANASGTIFVRARNYDPATGRWISMDPIGIDGGINLYEYCYGNPLLGIDIDGYKADKTVIGQGIVDKVGDRLIDIGMTQQGRNYQKALEEADRALTDLDSWGRPEIGIRNRTEQWVKQHPNSKSVFNPNNVSSVKNKFMTKNHNKLSQARKTLDDSFVNMQSIKRAKNVLTVLELIGNGKEIWDFINTGLNSDWDNLNNWESDNFWTNVGMAGGEFIADIVTLQDQYKGHLRQLSEGKQWLVPYFGLGNTIPLDIEYEVIVADYSTGIILQRIPVELEQNYTGTYGTYFTFNQEISSEISKKYHIQLAADGYCYVGVRYDVFEKGRNPGKYDYNYSKTLQYSHFYSDSNVTDGSDNSAGIGDICEIPNVLSSLYNTNQLDPTMAASDFPEWGTDGSLWNNGALGGRFGCGTASLDDVLSCNGLQKGIDYNYHTSMGAGRLFQNNASGNDIILYLLGTIGTILTSALRPSKRIYAVAVDNVTMNSDGSSTVYYTDPYDRSDKLCSMVIDAEGNGKDENGRTVAGMTVINAGALRQLSPDKIADKIIYTENSAVKNTTLNAITVAPGTALQIGENVTLAGSNKLMGSLCVTSQLNFEKDSVINFDLTQLTPSTTAMVNNIQYLTGADLVITVDQYQTVGDYVIASNASNFLEYFTLSATISTGYVFGTEHSGAAVSANLDSFDLGTIAAGETIKNGDGIYSLWVSENNSLILSVSNSTYYKEDFWFNNPAHTLIHSITQTQSDNEQITVSWKVNSPVFDVLAYDLHIRCGEQILPVYNLPSNEIDLLNLDAQSVILEIKPEQAQFWKAESLTLPDSSINNNPSFIQSTANNNTDVFFANISGSWALGYAAQHLGILNSWSGTNEQVILTDKNKLSDIFEGSTDTNILVMTDDANGDALFVDDIYTALPGTVAEQQARIAQIDEIRAGFGDDIVDMTSQRFAYVGDGVKVYGGLGNDTIWANKGSNTLFGDAGNDRIVGGSGDDIIIGGIGNDSMHGGGGSDIFCFGGNWGTDTIEQLAGGAVTLWFETGSESNWNADTMTYSDGSNSVKVSGVDTVTLKFGADASLPAGCFADAASEKIFEDKDSGMLA